MAFFLSGTFSSEKHLGPEKHRKKEHGKLRPLSSNLRTKVTVEVIGRLHDLRSCKNGGYKQYVDSRIIEVPHFKSEVKFVRGKSTEAVSR